MKLELFDWMSEAYDLSGTNLLVFAIIYNGVEVTTKQVARFSGLSQDEAVKVLAYLRGEGLIKNNHSYLWSVVDDIDDFLL